MLFWKEWLVCFWMSIFNNKKKADLNGNNFLLRNIYQILLSHNEGRCSVKLDYNISGVGVRNFHSERLWGLRAQLLWICAVCPLIWKRVCRTLTKPSSSSNHWVMVQCAYQPFHSPLKVLKDLNRIWDTNNDLLQERLQHSGSGTKQRSYDLIPYCSLQHISTVNNMHLTSKMFSA